MAHSRSSGAGRSGAGPGGRPVTVVYLARTLRDFGDGFVALLLPVYLTACGFNALEIGIVAMFALLGSALATLATGFLGARVDPRSLLLAASGLMAATGFALAASRGVVLVLLLLLAFAGTVNPSTGSVSPFVPLEHAVLARSTDPRTRTATFARYSLIGAIAAAAGSLAAAGSRLLENAGLSTLGSLQAMFVIYAVLGIAVGLSYSRLPRSAPSPDGRGGVAPLGPSRRIVYRLAALFTLDAFAGGLVVQSLLALWLFDRFGLSLSAAGVLFFWTGVASAFSFPAAAWLASRIGLVRTMVFTHIPASLLLVLCALSPSVELALAALVLRAALSQMDVPTRSSYVMAVVTPPERTAAASLTSVPRSLAAAVGPVIAGALLEAGLTAWPLLLCGALKIVYDLALWSSFRGLKPPEEGPATSSA